MIQQYPDKTVTRKSTCIIMFTAALFTIAKAWKHLNVHCQMNGWNGILLSHKRNKIMPFAATWVDLEIIILREARKRKTKYLMIPFIYIYNVDTIIYIYM